MKLLNDMLNNSVAVSRAVLREFKARMVESPAAKRHAKVGPLHLWKEKRDFQIRYLQEIGLQPHHYLLDIGCGTLRGGIPIIDFLETGHYYGVEARLPVLEEGKQELRESNLQHKNPTLIHSASLASLDLETRFDIIWAFAVLIHMDDDILADCMGFVARHLKPGGRFYTNVNIGEKRDARYNWQGFPVVWRDWEYYRSAGLRHGLAVSDLGSLRSMDHSSGVDAIDEQRMLEYQWLEGVVEASETTL